MAGLITLEPFNCEGSTSSQNVKWEHWKRALFIYLEATNIKNPVKKRATLLHTAGINYGRK